MVTSTVSVALFLTQWQSRMNVRSLPWLAFGLLLGSLLGIAFGKGDPRAPLFLGAIGGLLGFFGYAGVSAVHRTWKIDASKTDYLAILGALLGSICGSVIGAISGFGRLMISTFNPDLPERDFAASFGAIGGLVLGALSGACLVSAIGPLLRRRSARRRKTLRDKQIEGNRG